MIWILLKIFPDNKLDILISILNKIKSEGLPDEQSFEKLVRGTAESFGVKVVVVAQQIRIALTGKTVSPSLFDIISIIGLERTTKRFEKFIEFFTKIS